EWVHVQLHQQKGMISLSPPTICNSAIITDDGLSENARAELEKQEASLLMVSTHYPPTSLRTA
ncbi:hypothetical protein OGY21_00480, partial [Citrobacter sp. Cpo113]|nr:hypothetical protein [Citrobacter sp. Cpo113]